MNTLPPLELLVCSVTGCATDLIALLSHEDETTAGPIRLCQAHYDAALRGIEDSVKAEAAARKDEAERHFFDSLSPIEQAQLDSR